MDGRISSSWRIEEIVPKPAGSGTITSMYRVHKVTHPTIPKPTLAHRMLAGSFAYAVYIALMGVILLALVR